MSWWQKCHGGTNVLFYNRWDKCLILAIGGTNVMVALMSGGTCVSGRNDSGTYDGGTKVAPPLLGYVPISFYYLSQEESSFSRFKIMSFYKY
jgi:hypothetical protein